MDDSDDRLEAENKEISTSEPSHAEATTESLDQPKLEKRAPRFWVRTLRILLGVFILIGVGALLAIYLLYVPTRHKLLVTKSEMEAAANTTSAQLNQANQEIDRLSSFEKKNQELQAELEKISIHNTILQLRIDVATAQLALAKEDPSMAHLALNKTSETIQTLKNSLPVDQQKVTESLETRLELVLKEIEGDAETAQTDLGVMMSTLLELESSLVR
jgi:TolA-binding protein